MLPFHICENLSIAFPTTSSFKQILSSPIQTITSNLDTKGDIFLSYSE
jgi:hypothetical protein